MAYTPRGPSILAISPSKSPIQASKHQIKSETPDFDKCRPYFGWVNADTIRDTFKHTTQWGASVGTFPKDISIILLYTFYQPVFYATRDQHFPSDSEERASFWVGFAEHCGDSLTHMVLDTDTFKIIYRSALRPRSPKDPNKRLVDAGGEEDHQPHSKPTKHPAPVPDGEKSAQPSTPTVYIKSRHDDGPTSSKPLPEFNPDDLVGRTFLLPPGDNGERLRAKVTRNVVEYIEQADGERVQQLWVLAMVNWKRSYPITNLWVIWKLQPMKK